MVRSLTGRLWLVALFGILPSAVLSLSTIVDNARDLRNRQVDAADDLMRAVLSAVDAELKSSRAALDALAASRRLARRDLYGFRDEAQVLAARRPEWADVVLSEPSGAPLLDLLVPPGQAPSSALAADELDEVVRTARPGVGGVVDNEVLRGRGFAVHVPVIEDGRVAMVLSAIVRPDSILALLRQQNVPDGGVVAILDRQSRFIARTLDHASWVGQPASPSLRSLIDRSGEHGWHRGETREGVMVYSVFRRSAYSGWSAAIGLPARALDARVIESYAAVGGATLVAILLGLLAAEMVAKTIRRPIRALAAAARAVDRGDTPALPASGVPEIREATEALAAALRKERDARLNAEHANRTKDEFLAMLGHELRNPLAGIASATHLLDRGVVGDMAVQARAIIRRQVRQLARVTDDLLDAGRVMTDKIRLRRESVALDAFVERELESLRATGALGARRLDAALAPTTVDADPVRLAQIVGNLLGNAVKYTADDGRIEVRVRDAGEHAVLEVVDDGIGIDAELLPRVFDLFVQGERTIDRALGGLGIGLTLVRRLVELHDGRVVASSDGPNLGTRIEVRLPAVRAAR